MGLLEGKLQGSVLSAWRSSSLPHLRVSLPGAQLLLAGTTAGAAQLRCRVLSELARCQALLAEPRARQTLAQAAALCADAQGTAWGCAPATW